MRAALAGYGRQQNVQAGIFRFAHCRPMLRRGLRAGSVTSATFIGRIFSVIRNNRLTGHVGLRGDR